MLINHHGSTYIERMYMAGGQYERDHLPDGSWRNLTYITTPAGLSAVFIQNEGSQEEEFYFIHTDYHGSIMALTDYNGQLLEEYSCDPWGNRRYPETWENMYTNTTNPTAGQSGSQSLLWGVGGALFRGYTFHEHLDCFALINMNGRMYDPILGRMLSPDNYVQSPSNTQNLNRYNYVLNNPLKYTDPSGEILFPVLMGAGISVLTNGMNNYYNNRPFLEGALGAAITGAIGGAASFGIGNLASTLTLTGFSKIAFQTTAHGMLGTMMSTLSGGSPGQGFLSGAVSSLTAHYSHKLLGKASRGWQMAGMIGSSGLAGGLSAKLAGGNFWDGARNGLISSGLNHGLHLSDPRIAVAIVTGKVRHYFGPDAIAISGELAEQVGIGIKQERGYFRIMRGSEAGNWTRFSGMAGSIGGPELSANLSVMELFYSGSISTISYDVFLGEYYQWNASVDLGIGVGISAMYSPLDDGYFTIGYGFNISLDAVPSYFNLSGQYGKTWRYNKDAMFSPFHD